MHVDVLFISHALLYKVNLFYNLCLGSKCESLENRFQLNETGFRVLVFTVPSARRHAMRIVWAR